jgi:hypothetical protein
MLSKDNPGGRAAIRRIELPWRNETSDPMVGEGECSIPQVFVDSSGFALHPTGALQAKAIPARSFAR